MSRSAGINFGVPNSEYRLRIDPVTGEAVSCYNQDTDTEYIGGGGDSDFSTAEVTLINNTENVINEQFPCCVEENELGEGSPAAITTSIGGFNPGNTTIKIPLYKGYAFLYKFTEVSISVSGDITLIGASTIAVSGNGTITFEQQ